MKNGYFWLRIPVFIQFRNENFCKSEFFFLKWTFLASNATFFFWSWQFLANYSIFFLKIRIFKWEFLSKWVFSAKSDHFLTQKQNFALKLTIFGLKWQFFDEFWNTRDWNFYMVRCIVWFLNQHWRGPYQKTYLSVSPVRWAPSRHISGFDLTLKDCSSEVIWGQIWHYFKISSIS